MKTCIELHSEVEVKTKQRLQDFIHKKGKKSKFSNEIVLPVKDDVAYNLEGGRYLAEISNYALIDNKGYTYGFSALTLEQLCEVVDSLKIK